jgi:hypothetical protein
MTMLKQIEGDLLAQPRGLLAHQVNLAGVMGHGLARQIRDKWPQVYAAYHAHDHKLGQCFLVEVQPELYVANLYGQLGLGIHGRKTHYGYLAQALQSLHFCGRGADLPIFIPWHMSSDLAGGGDPEGTWAVVEELIMVLVPEATIVKLPKYDPILGKPA